MRITFTKPSSEKIKKVKFGFNWVLFGFGEIYAIPFFFYRLHLFGIIFLISIFACAYFAIPYYHAFEADPTIVFDLDKILPYYTLPLDIAAISNLTLLIIGGMSGNAMIAKKLLKKGWKIVTPDESVKQKIVKKWKVTENDFTGLS